MIIETNKVVTFNYRVRDNNNEVLEDSNQSIPMVYLHGYNGIFKGLENAMNNKKVGDVISVKLSPDEAYGQRQENSIQRISIKHLVSHGKKPIKYKPGMIVQINMQNGTRNVVVVKAGLKTVDVDINHPLAGKTLDFEIEIVDVRDATSEEIAHKHVHGEGGHHH